MKPNNLFFSTINAVPIGWASTIILFTILTLTLMPSDDVPSISIPHIDKLVHFLMFGALSATLLFDFARISRKLHPGLWLGCALAAALIGGAIELLQDLMGYGRSAEWADLAADSAGAILLPLPVIPLISTLLSLYRCSIIPVRNATDIPVSLRHLYHNSFPDDERRPWTDIETLIEAHNLFKFCIIRSANNPVGFISCWQLPTAVYIEHFAIDIRLRSHGLGSMALNTFCKSKSPYPVILEVEPADATPMASRRISFYGRCGFVGHPDFPYIQPAYTPTSSPVELMLMTFGVITDLHITAADILRIVYNSPNKA